MSLLTSSFILFFPIVRDIEHWLESVNRFGIRDYPIVIGKYIIIAEMVDDSHNYIFMARI